MKPFLNKKLALQLTHKHGTPIYIYSQSIIKKRYKELSSAFFYQPFEIHYACKANDNSEVLKLIRRFGAGIETVSPGEIKKTLKAGFKPSQISYTSTSVSDSELIFTASKKIAVIADSLSQLERFGKLKLGPALALRLNQGIGSGHHSHVITGGADSKFGIEIQQLPEAIHLAVKHNLKVIGLHQHIGSNILDYKIFIKAARALMKTAKGFPDLDFLNFGGGFGVPYRPNEQRLDTERFGRSLSSEFSNFCKNYGKQLKLIIEPGRFLIAEAGILLVRVTEIKRNSKIKFVGVDSGFNHLLRPALYGSYHEIVNLTNPKRKKERVWIVGNICESGDIFGRDRMIAQCREGDVLAILNAGAYGYVMSSEYNSRIRPKEILI